jgi:DNA repair photolyase
MLEMAKQKRNKSGLRPSWHPMEIRPLLFDLHPEATTTRDVARAVKAGGREALTEAVRRADDATYQEVTCRSALNRVEGMPFNWTLNPYRGCTHGCHYCFARRYHTQFELGVGDDFASMILVKKNLVEVLKRELDQPSWHRETVAVGTATDPYQPIEGQYRLTRRSLEALARARTPVGIVTKGPMIVRDRDVLVDLSRQASCNVYVSVPCVDDDMWEQLEPGTAHPLQRLRAVGQLVDSGINAGVLMAPIVPGLTSQPARLERTVKAIADHGARFVGANVMYLKDGTKTHFMQWLDREYPQLVPRYQKLYRGAYAPTSYKKEVQAVIRLLQQRYGLHQRPSSEDVPGESSEPDQQGFEW